MNKFIYLLLLILPGMLSAQEKITNPRYQNKLWLVGISYKAIIPAGDLALRYGLCNAFGIGLDLKTKKNYLFGVSIDAMFGRNVKDIGYMDKLKDANGYVYSDEGAPGYFTASMRGMKAAMTAGKIIPLHSKRPEWGVILQAGAGYFQHKNLFSFANSLQFSSTYLRGYDRMRNGIAISEEAGVCHFNLNRLINFNITLEAVEAFTKNSRYYDYATQSFDTKKYTDIYLAIKFAWVLPVKASDKDAPVYFK
jgi:hypothetical protein